MAINTSAIADLLRPGLNAVFGEFSPYPSQWTEIFKSYPSEMSVEYDEEMKMLGLAEIRAEGAPTAIDTMGQRIKTSYNHKDVALGFVITKNAIRDNLYKTRFPMMAEALRDSLAQTKEILAASVLNNGFNSAYPIGDGKALFATDHPIDGGTFSNKSSTNADLNEGSLESAIIAIQQFKNQAGLIVKTMPTKLLVPPQGQFVAERLCGSAFRTNTANNDISAIYNTSAIPQGYKVNQFLTGANNWFLLTDSNNGFKHFVRYKVETDMYADWSTDNLMCKATERYSFGCSNARAAYGSQGS